MIDIAEQIDALASREGFPLIGFAEARDNDRFDLFSDWLDRGYHGEMSYLKDRQEAYRHPKHVLEGCQSVIMLAMPYAPNPRTIAPKGGGNSPQKTTQNSVPNASESITTPSLSATERREAFLGNYAVGDVDYHDFIRQKLNTIIQEISPSEPSANWRGVVDTAPLMERDYARLAGLGWIGKNTLLLNREWGSYFFLAALLTDLKLPPTESLKTDHCGNCTACLDACPTQAFVAPHVMDASRCISYLSIEFRGSIPEHLRPKMENWIFGCDVCQIVCPWNRKRKSGTLPVLEPENLEQKQSLRHWLTLDEDEFRQLYKKKPFWRTKLRGMQRNALIAAANNSRYDLLPLIELHCQSPNEVVSETARWAFELLKHTG